MSQKAVTQLEIVRVQQGKPVDVQDFLATEEPLEIRLVYGHKANPQRKNLAVTMRTPGNDAELALGFLLTEGIISSKADVTDCTLQNENAVQVTLREDLSPELGSMERNFYTTSSCGVCGKASIDAIRTECAWYDKSAPFTVPAALLQQLPDALREHQQMFKDTGGIHAAALFDTAGKLLLLREDVGRHNALDKLIGAALQDELLPLQQHILVLSGRASFELVQKSVMAGLKMIVAVGAPSSLAVQTADEFGITLAGFVKHDRMNIYCGAERILVNENKAI